MRSGWLLGGVALAALSAACGGDDDSGLPGGWTELTDLPDMSAPTDVWVFSETDVWVLDEGSAVHRYDGTSWSTLETPSTAALGCIFALSPTDVWLCGEQLLHYDGSEFTAIEVPIPGIGLTDAWAASPSDIFAIGGFAARVAHYDGDAWSATDLMYSPEINVSVWGAAADDVYVLGSSALHHWDGATWTEIEIQLDGPSGEGQVWGTGASDVWVMPGSNRLSHWDGSSWDTLETELVGEPTAAWGAAPDDLWAVGSPGSWSRYDGDAWQELAHQESGALYQRDLVAIHGLSATHIWAVGQEYGPEFRPLIYRYDP